MNPNPVMKKLGLDVNDRALIIHADDLGMCQSTLPAFHDLTEFGLVTSGAVMVPCPWFPAAAAYFRAHPQLDIGVHITLTSEWDAYRWGPVSTRDPNSGLMDAEGYFPRTEQEIQKSGDASAAQVEMLAQVERALAAGIDVTHIDTHMGAVLHPKFMPAYAMTALRFRLPLLALRFLDAASWMGLGIGLEPETAAAAAQFTRQLEETGVTLHDGLFYTTLERPEIRTEEVKRILSNLPCGLSRLYIHPQVDTPEARAVSPDWAGRLADYRAFMSEETAALIKSLGIQLIHYRMLREVMRA